LHSGEFAELENRSTFSQFLAALRSRNYDWIYGLFAPTWVLVIQAIVVSLSWFLVLTCVSVESSCMAVKRLRAILFGPRQRRSSSAPQRPTRRRHSPAGLRRLELLEGRNLLAADGSMLAAQFPHNSAYPEDVDASGIVSPVDAVLVVNLLNDLRRSAFAADSGSASGESATNFYPDVDGNGILAPLDALRVINQLNAEAEPPPAACTAADTAMPVITACEVRQLLARGAAASATDDAILAIVDRGGRILGVRVEDDVLLAIPDELTRVFAIDGAVAKARTAAFFSSNSAPLTSRTVRFISQSTVTQREVESNPTVADPLVDHPFDPLDPSSRTFGPGFVAPVGIGGHFPPDVMNTPPVDLFAIEHQSRDSLVHPGLDGVKGTGDDIGLPNRFDVASMQLGSGVTLETPESYGVQSNRVPHAQPRGIATLPGGVPLFKNKQLVGGIGVFFPGSDGYATHEQGFVPGIGQTTGQRLNAPRVLEAEWIAFAAAGGARGRSVDARVNTLGGIDPVNGYELPFDRIDLAGITLEIYGPHPTTSVPRTGIETLQAVGRALGAGDAHSGANQVVDPGPDLDPMTAADNATALDGKSVASGWLVKAHDSSLVGGLQAADVESIVEHAVKEAEQVRAAIRLPLGTRTRMVISVADTTGEVLGIFRMPDATVFSIDVSVAKARNTAYYADAGALVAEDRVDDDLLVARGAVAPGDIDDILNDGLLGSADLYRAARGGALVDASRGLAFTNRTFRFLAEPRYPAGIDGQVPPIFSILNEPGVNPHTAENDGPAAAASDFQSVLGFDAFHLGRNFRDPDAIQRQNGIVFFPGSTPLYKNGVLVGGFGVSGDGVDQDDVVTAAGMQGFAPPDAIRADAMYYRGVRLPFQKFNRNPFG
jgi:uncharacterized protein GlcG (DUF336 family)